MLAYSNPSIGTNAIAKITDKNRPFKKDVKANAAIIDDKVITASIPINLYLSLSFRLKGFSSFVCTSLSSSRFPFFTTILSSS